MIPQLQDLTWLEQGWQRLCGYVDRQRIPQGLLVSGQRGLGKGILVRAFAQKLLCMSEHESPCGHCISCQLFLAGTHPDLLVVAPAETGKALTVDGIRSLLGKLTLKGQYSKCRVVLIEPAHALNVSAANSLLKALEEPGEGTLLILVTDQLASLLPTIVSRCQQLTIGVPDRSSARQFLLARGLDASRADMLLSLANGSPLTALAIAESDVCDRRLAHFADWIGLSKGQLSPTAVAERWSSSPLDELSNWFGGWLEDLIRLAMTSQESVVRNHDLLAELNTLVRRLNLIETCRFLDEINAFRGGANSQLNRQLLLEQWMIRWLRMCLAGA